MVSAVAMEADAPAGLSQHAKTLERLASQCDAMCLKTGTQLGEAVPSLYELAAQFTALSRTLVDDGEESNTKRLEALSGEILAVATALLAEREVLTTLVTLNETLARHVTDVAENVYFLSALVSNVKIEVAAINEGEYGLEGFADNLRQLTANSQSTIDAFQTTHEALVKQIRHTAVAQSSFVATHGTKFHAAAQEILASLNAISDRRKIVADIVSEIGALTQKFGTQIAQCVVALQIGDSTRQRLEHVGEALFVAADLSSGIKPKQIPGDDAPAASPLHFQGMSASVCELQVSQVEAAYADFLAELETVSSAITQIAAVGAALAERSSGLGGSGASDSQSFLVDLQTKLGSAATLVGECGQSRKLVDRTAERVIDGVHGLQRLARDVAAMATDMTIIGTNAIVTSYRLGTKGLPLSVIAQHLRNHAVLVADAVTLATPALGAVMNAAQAFMAAREGKDAKSMEALTARINEAFTLFQAADTAVFDVRQRLDAEMSSVDALLAHAAEALHDVDDVTASLRTVVDGIVPSEGAHSGPDALTPEIDAFLRRLYTMGAERTIHDRLFPARVSQTATDSPVETEADGLWS